MTNLLRLVLFLSILCTGCVSSPQSKNVQFEDLNDLVEIEPGARIVVKGYLNAYHFYDGLVEGRWELYSVESTQENKEKCQFVKPVDPILMLGSESYIDENLVSGGQFREVLVEGNYFKKRAKFQDTLVLKEYSHFMENVTLVKSGSKYCIK